MDALSVLRDFTVREELGNVQQVGDEFRFGDEYRFPCNMETGYRSLQGSLYTLDSLVFFVKTNSIKMKYPEYMQQARALKIPTVTYTDRKPLSDYLEGRVATCDAIQILPLDRHHHHHRPDDDEQERAKRLKSSSPHMDAALRIQLVRDMERPVRDRDTILLCPNKTFESVLNILSRREDDRRKAEPPLPPPPPPQQQQQQQHKFVKVEGDHKNPAAIPPLGESKRGHQSSHHHQQQHQQHQQHQQGHQQGHQHQQMKGKSKVVEGAPIILVPNASQTLLNTFNAKEFLEDGVYRPADAEPKPKKADSVIIHRKIGRDMPVKYEIRDKPTSLSAKDWERVVAVFVLGKEWQFKDWPFKDHVEIFNKILGVYLRFEDDSMESVKVVMQWNVKIISLSKHKRHQDRTAVLEFWDKLDAFIRARRLPILF